MFKKNDKENFTTSDIIKGIKGISKSILGIDIVNNQDLIDKRLSVCLQCDRMDKKNNRCLECGCFLKYKITLVDEKCPLGKW